MSALSGGWLYLVERGSPVTHARADCRNAAAAALERLLIPYGTRPLVAWQRCEVCGGARPVDRREGAA